MPIDVRRFVGVRVVIVAACCFMTLAAVSLYASAQSPSNLSFQQTWERTDKPVADRQVDRTWMWGNQSITGEIREEYYEAGGGSRFVQYFDKARMEINHDASIPENSPWRVTNGLLVVELVTGKMQIGDHAFKFNTPAVINVASDPDDATGPTYATFDELLHAPPVADGSEITQRLHRDGNVFSDPGLAGNGVTAANRVQIDGIDHQVASVFWSFMNSVGVVFEDGAYSTAPLFVNPFYATGYPITEAYWVNVKIAGSATDVLVQCFERRCLTYTPTNPDGWKVEAGNVGRHYYEWRHGTTDGATPPPGSTATATTSSTPTMTRTAIATATMSPTPTATATSTQPPPTSTPTQTSEQLAYWYLHPDQAAYRAIDEFCGCAQLGDSFTDTMMEESFTLRHMYNLATASVGEFNASTDGYYKWQKEWIRMWTVPQSEVGAYFADINRRVINQVRVAVQEPGSQIGTRIRTIESGQDPVFRQLGHTGPRVYWDYLLDPRYNMAAVTPLDQDIATRVFEQLEYDYTVAVASGSWSGDFGSYLLAYGERLL